MARADLMTALVLFLIVVTVASLGFAMGSYYEHERAGGTRWERQRADAASAMHQQLLATNRDAQMEIS